MSYRKLGINYGGATPSPAKDDSFAKSGFNYKITTASVSDGMITMIENNDEAEGSHSSHSSHSSRSSGEDYLGFYKRECNSLDTKSFPSVRDTIYRYLNDDNCPAAIKILFGDWIFRKMYMYYKLYGDKKTNVCEKLYPPIGEVRDVVMKGEYLKYHDIDAMNNVCENFYLERFDDKDRYFILQMLNDASLVKNFNYQSTYSEEELKQHFLTWVEKSGIHEQKSNLLDVLLREYPRDIQVKKVFEEMRFGDGKKKDIYSDAQNVHSIDKTAVKVADILLNDMNNGYATADDIERLTNLEVSIPNDLKIVIQLPTIPIEWREYITSKTHALLRDVEIKNIDKAKAIECTIERLCIDTTRFGENSFTTAELYVGVLSFIKNYEKEIIITRLPGNNLELVTDETKHMPGGGQILRERLLEEIDDMKELCISGYVTRLMNVLQGFDDRYAVLMNFDKQLYAVLSHKIAKALEKAPENVVYGTFDDEYKRDYLEFLQKIVNNTLPQICKEYGAEDVGQCIITVISSLSNYQEWVYDQNCVTYTL